MRSIRAAGILAAAVALAAPARSAPIVVNGGFEAPAVKASTEFGSRFGGQVVPGWTSAGYTFLYRSGAADAGGALTEYGPGRELWGPGNGSANGLPAASPSGGDYIAANGAHYPGPLAQTVKGLNPGSVAVVTFWWAGAQERGFLGDTTEAWSVSLGGETQSTEVLSNPSRGFTGWRRAALSFVATGTSEVLSFLAVGTPSGVPPFVLLDGVAVTQVPEPASMAVLGAALLAVGLANRRRSRRSRRDFGAPA